MSTKSALGEFKFLVKLLAEFEESSRVVSADEFLNLKTHCHSLVTETEAARFLVLAKHLEPLGEVTEMIISSFKMFPDSRRNIIVLLVYIIFFFDADNYQDAVKCFKAVGCGKSLKVLSCVAIEDNLIEVIRICCKVYCSEYVLANILQPLMEKMHVLQDLYSELEYLISKRGVRPKKELTKPKEPKLSNFRPVPKTPLNTPFPSFTFLIPKPPRKPINPEQLQKNLKEAHEMNAKKAAALLERAQKEAFSCAVPKKPPPGPSSPERFVFKAKVPPPKKEVSVKGTAASVMREAATLAKEEEKTLKVLEDVMQGAYDPGNIQDMERELRKIMEEENAREIQRKHLEGLLTYEEAILAKKKQAKENELKVQMFKEERLKMLEEVNAWRMEEEEKMKEVLEKIKAIERGAKEAGKKATTDKHEKARELAEESRRLLQESLDRQNEELKRKAALIKEIRAMHQVRMLETNKEFDPTDCPNFGFMCEMSIAELRERLALLRLEMREELDEKREAIRRVKGRRGGILESARNFISQTRMSKPKAMPSDPPKLERSKELVELQEKLELARSMRMNTG